MNHRSSIRGRGWPGSTFTSIVIGLAMVVFAPLIGVSCSGSSDATATPESRIDTAMNSYLQELAVLRDSLTEFGNPDGSGGSLQDVRDSAARLMGYAPFFATLTQERQAYVNDKYGAELGSLLQQIASRAIGAVEISGEQEIAMIVQQIPGLGATSTDSSRQ